MFRFVRRRGYAFVAICLAAFATPLYAQTATAPKPEEKAAAADLPSAKSIIDRHIQASGGAAALKEYKSSHATGQVTIPANGMTGTVEIFAMRPNKILVKQNLAGIGEISEGFDGTHAWAISAMTGPMLVTGKALEQRKLDSDFDSSIDPSIRYSGMKTLEKTTFDGRDVYKVSMTRREGGEDVGFFDLSTGLRAGTIATRESPMGNITVTSTVSDYKKFGNVLMPTALKQSVNGIDVVITVTAVEFNNVEPAVFELPAEIKALIK